MDPVPLGLGLALVGVIIYLFKELGERDRALVSAQHRIEEFQKLVSDMRDEPSGQRHAQLADRRSLATGDVADRATLIEHKASD